MTIVPSRFLLRIGAACTLFAATAGAPVHAADVPVAAASPQQLATSIDEQLDQPRFAAAGWGIAVVSLDTGRTLYAHNADRLLQTASTAKLYTAALVLDAIGTDYRIPTQLLT